MKQSLVTLSLTLATAATLAQGLVNFSNTPTTLVSAGSGGAATAISGPPGTYYFALLSSASSSAQGPWVSTGLYATNLPTAGMFSGGVAAIPGLAPGSPFYYVVAGWSTNLGHDFNPQWESGNGLTNYFDYYGLSDVGFAVLGGNAQQAKLSAFISGGSIVISWTPRGGTLQSSPSLGAGETWSTVGTANPATVTISGNAEFFRVVPAVYPTPDLFGPSGVRGFELFPGAV
jgi:hypothetical protein